MKFTLYFQLTDGTTINVDEFESSVEAERIAANAWDVPTEPEAVINYKGIRFYRKFLMASYIKSYDAD